MIFSCHVCLGFLGPSLAFLLFTCVPRQTRHCFISIPLPTYDTPILVCEDDGCGQFGRFKKLFICPSDGFCTLSKHTVESEHYSPFSQPAEKKIFVPIVNLFHLRFFFFLTTTVALNVLLPFFCLILFLISTLLYLFYWPCIYMFEFAGLCRQWGPHTLAPTLLLCISKGSESAVAKAQGEWDSTI